MLDSMAIDNSFNYVENKKPINNAPDNLIDVLNTRQTTRSGWKLAGFNKPFSIFEKGNISVEVITIKQVNNGKISEIVRDCDSLYDGTYETFLREKGYNVRLKPHEISNNNSTSHSIQYEWETSGVNIIEVYQQAFLGKIDGVLRVRSIVKYVDINYTSHVREKTYYHDDSERISVRDFMLREKLFVRKNMSGIKHLLKPQIKITHDMPRNKILYDSRFPGQSYKDLTHLLV